MVPALGGARREAERRGEESVGRNEAAAEHGGGNDAPAESGAVRRADGGRRSAVAEPDFRDDRGAAGMRARRLIYTTHYMEEAERLCDRIAIIDHGQIIARGHEGRAGARARLEDRSQVLARFAGDEAMQIAAWAGAARRTSDGRDGGVHDRAGDGDCAAAGRCDEGRPGAGGCYRCVRPNLEIGVSAPDGKGVTRLILHVARTALIALQARSRRAGVEFCAAAGVFLDLRGDLWQRARYDAEGAR